MMDAPFPNSAGRSVFDGQAGPLKPANPFGLPTHAKSIWSNDPGFQRGELPYTLAIKSKGKPGAKAATLPQPTFES
jgi:hypothetical protein